MDSFTVHFKFSQHFNFPVEKAYKWCTDYQPGDIRLQGTDGERKVHWINEDTVVLTDIYYADTGRISRLKLVRLYPERFTWTNTRISPEGRYSQFLYEIVSEKGGSRLDFTGSQIVAGKKPSHVKLKALAAETEREDSATWRNLAKAMAKDLSKNP